MLNALIFIPVGIIYLTYFSALIFKSEKKAYVAVVYFICAAAVIPLCVFLRAELIWAELSLLLCLMPKLIIRR